MGDSIGGRSRRETLVGQIVDGHELLRVLASGGMGEVYLARHLRLGIQRAIKVIREDQRSSSGAAERFLREAQVLSHLQHNSIVQIVEFGELPSGWPFLVMEFIDGPNLDQMIERLGPFSLRDGLVVLEQIASALAYAHAQGVVHRDLKPANVLLRAGDLRQVKVIDFGLAHTVSQLTLSRLTAEGQVLGSPQYMAPEQADGNLDITSAADAYALAGVAYALLSGKPVFPGLPLMALIFAHAAEAPVRLSTRRVDVPQALDDVLFACLAKDPAARPTVESLASQLAQLAGVASKAPASTIVQGIDPRGATMLGPSRTGQSEISRLIATPPTDDGVSEPLLNQLVSLVDEIAGALSAQEPSLARLLAAVRKTSESLTDLEMELAVLDANGDNANRDELSRKITVIRAEQLDLQRQLASRVDELRSVGDSATSRLFMDLDDVISQLRSVQA